MTPEWQAAIDGWLSWLRAGQQSASTLRLRRWQVEHLARAFPDVSPWALTADQLAGFLGSSVWKPETARSMRACLTRFYAWAHDGGHVDVNPAKRLPPIRIPRALPKPAGDDVVSRAIASADDRVGLMIRLAALAGLRAAEIAALPWSAIDDSRLVITGKGGHARNVPLHPELAAAMDAEHERRMAGGRGSGFRYQGELLTFVFPGRTSGPATPGNVTKALSAVLGDATAHCLRHRFASRAYALGGRDLRAVQELLGHSKPETTARYTAVPDGALEAAVMAAG